MNIDSFSNSIKYIQSSTIPIEPKKRDWRSLLKCFFRKKPPLKDISLNIDIYDVVNNLRKMLKEYLKINMKKIQEENFETFYNYEKIENKVQEICFNKYQYLAEIYNLDEKLKEEVDKYALYFNIDKILNKQSTKMNIQTKKITEQEECKTEIECIICMEYDRNTVFYPCMHLITCEKCGFEKVKNDCPQCHTVIEKKEVVLI